MRNDKARGKATSSGKARGGEEGQSLPLGARVAAVLFLLAVVLLIIGRLNRAGVGSVVVAVGVAVVGGLVLAGSRWGGRRQDQVKVIADTVEGVIGRPVVRVSGVKWRWRRLDRVIVEYPPHVSDSDPRLRERASGQLAARMGGPVDLTWDTTKRTLTIERRAHVAPEDRRDPLPQVARIETVVELIFGADARVKALDWEGELLSRFLVSYPPTSRDAADQWRIQADAVLMEKTGQWWVSYWEPESDQVTYAVRTALPSQVDHTDIGDLPALPPPPVPPSPPTPVPPPNGGGGGGWGAPPVPAMTTGPAWPATPPVPASPPPPVPHPMPAPAPAPAPAPLVSVDVAALPFAKGRSEVLEWSPTGGAPHALVIGSTGSGKTATIRTFVVAAALRGYHIVICDPKRTELWGFEVTEWPNVIEVATELDAMVLLVERLYQEMEVRYRRIREEGPAVQRTLPPVLAVIDEAREWIDRIQASWKQAGGRGEHPTIEKFRSLARLARTARIFLLVGIQRPDAAVFGGEARDNFRTRVACGELSPQGAQMLGLTASGRVSENVPGRVMADVGNGWTEAQVIWTPDPSDDLSPDERNTINRLRPTTALPPLVLPDAELPEPDQPASRSKKPKPEPPVPPQSVTDVDEGAEGPAGGERRPDRRRPAAPSGGFGLQVPAPAGPPVLRVLQGGGQPDEVGEPERVLEVGGPAGWYVAGLRSVLESGLAHVAGRDEACPDRDPGSLGWSDDGHGGWVPNGERIGWADLERGELLLLPEVSMAAVGTHGEVTAGDLGKLLAEAGMLTRQGEGSHVGAKTRIGGGRPRVWVLDASVLSGVPDSPVESPAEVGDLGPPAGTVSEPGPTGPEVAPEAPDVAPPPVRHHNRFLDPLPPGVTRRGG